MVKAEGIRLRDSKVHDFELRDIIDQYTTEITVFDRLFWTLISVMACVVTDIAFITIEIPFLV